MPIMFIFVSLRTSADGLGFAAWFPQLQDLVPARVAGKFFGNFRTAWQSAGMISMFIAAWFLGSDPQWWKFNLIFTVALLCFVLKLVFLYPISAPYEGATKTVGMLLDLAIEHFFNSQPVCFVLFDGSISLRFGDLAISSVLLVVGVGKEKRAIGILNLFRRFGTIRQRAELTRVIDTSTTA